MRYAIGIDMGGTFIKYALISSTGDFLHTGKVPTVAPDSSAFAQLIVAIEHANNFAKQNKLTVEGIGVGTPGVVVNGIVVGSAENISGWEGVNIKQEVEKHFWLPCVADNDANAMGLGEYAYGAGREAEFVIFLTVGTGIGSAFIFDGKLFSGYQNRGAEFGHTPLIANGEPCACGAQGCVEAYATTVALVRDYKALLAQKNVTPTAEVNGEYVVERYKAGEIAAQEAFSRHFFYLGRAVAGLVNVFSPQLIVIGGRIAESGEFYTERLLEVARQHALPISAKGLQIRPAQLGNKAGCMGAAYMVLG